MGSGAQKGKKSLLCHKTLNHIYFQRCTLESCSLVAKLSLTLCDPMDCRLSASSVQGLSRHEFWSGLHFLLQEIIPTQGSNLYLLQWQADSLPLSHQGHVLRNFRIPKRYRKFLRFIDKIKRYYLHRNKIRMTSVFSYATWDVKDIGALP